jgi:hypothetical protein
VCNNHGEVGCDGAFCNALGRKFPSLLSAAFVFWAMANGSRKGSERQRSWLSIYIRETSLGCEFIPGVFRWLVGGLPSLNDVVE